MRGLLLLREQRKPEREDAHQRIGCCAFLLGLGRSRRATRSIPSRSRQAPGRARSPATSDPVDAQRLAYLENLRSTDLRRHVGERPDCRRAPSARRCPSSGGSRSRVAVLLDPATRSTPRRREHRPGLLAHEAARRRWRRRWRTLARRRASHGPRARTPCPAAARPPAPSTWRCSQGNCSPRRPCQLRVPPCGVELSEAGSRASPRRRRAGASATTGTRERLDVPHHVAVVVVVVLPGASPKIEVDCRRGRMDRCVQVEEGGIGQRLPALVGTDQADPPLPELLPRRRFSARRASNPVRAAQGDKARRLQIGLAGA